jgi:hypothetical protein
MRDLMGRPPQEAHVSAFRHEAEAESPIGQRMATDAPATPAIPGSILVGQTETTRSPLRQLDVLKGACSFAVLCIHGELGKSTRFHKLVVNRAVPMFIVCFGISSERWRRQNEDLSSFSFAREWIVGRLSGLAPAWWMFLTCWYLTGSSSMQIRWLKSIGIRFKRKLPFQMIFGYAMPLLPPTWFVTEVLLMTLFTVPTMSVLCHAAPVAATLSATCLSAIALQAPGLCGQSMQACGFDGNNEFDWLLCPIIYAGRVAFGISLEKHVRGRPADSEALLASVVYLLGCKFVIDPRLTPRYRDALAATLDLPLSTVALWAAARVVDWTNNNNAEPHLGCECGTSTIIQQQSLSGRGVRSAAGLLSALGQRSWNVYLGHLTVLQCLFFRTGIFATWNPTAAHKVAIFLVSGLAFDAACSNMLLVRARHPHEQTPQAQLRDRRELQSVVGGSARGTGQMS